MGLSGLEADRARRNFEKNLPHRAADTHPVSIPEIKRLPYEGRVKSLTCQLPLFQLECLGGVE